MINSYEVLCINPDDRLPSVMISSPNVYVCSCARLSYIKYISPCHGYKRTNCECVW